MRNELTSLDFLALKTELKKLEGARIDKVYQRNRELTIHVYNPGDKKYRIFLAPGKSFITSYKRDNPEKPPNFCMMLRKHLSGSKITRIEQRNLDRVIEFHTDDKMLVAELFGKGNYILVKKEGNVILQALDAQEWSDRKIYRGEEYVPPPSGTDPRDIDTLKNFVSSKQIVKVLASDIGLGGVYSEEILERAGVDKEERSDRLGEKSLEKIYIEMNDLVAQMSSGRLKPRIYYDEKGDPVDVAPLIMEKYREFDKKTFKSFSSALDTYFTERQKAEYRRQKREAYRKKKHKLEGMKKQQEQKIKGMENSLEEKKEIGDLIYHNYGTVEDIIDTLRRARKNYSEEEVREKLTGEKAQGVREAQIIEDIRDGMSKVVVDLGEYNAVIDVELSVEKNAEEYYQKYKKSKDKLKGAKKALKETKKKLEELERNKEDIDISEAFKNKEDKRKKKRWYEKFRWFFSSDGFLVVGGMDKTSNEVLVKKHMENHDRYVHADFDGAPSVIIKNPDKKDIPEKTIEEAAQLAVTYSKAWKVGVGADDAYHVSPEQVTKEPEPGEYLGKGAFVIRGERSYMRNVKVSAAVGSYERNDGYVPMGGPISAVNANCEHLVEVKQGRKKKSDVGKQIQRHLHDKTGKDFDIDMVMRALPPGKCEIKEKR